MFYRIVLVFCYLHYTVNGDSAPVLLLSTIPCTPVTALKSYSSNEFAHILSSHLSEDTLGIIIIEPNLSAEDISFCRTPNGITCFRHLQTVPNKLYLRNVKNPLEILKEINRKSAEQIDIYDEFDFSINQSIIAKPGKFLFIYLNDVKADESNNLILTRHDQFIGKLIRHLEGTDKNFVIVYTSIGTKNHHRYAREVHNKTSKIQEQYSFTPPPVTTYRNSPKSTVLQNDHFIFYYDELLEVKGKKEIPIMFNSIKVDENENKLKIELNDGTNKLSFDYLTTGGYWTLNNIQWNMNKLYLDTDITAIDGFSYHCTPKIIFKMIVNDRVRPALKLSGLQCEGKLTLEGVPWTPLIYFNKPWDCVGFTNPAIINGSLVVILLLTILAIGISSIMDLQTMSRFEDPKAKSITIIVDN